MEGKANISVEIDKDVKIQAEEILSKLGLSPDIVITLLYKQIVLHNGIPFEIKLPSNHKSAFTNISDESQKEKQEKLESIKNFLNRKMNE